jgi:thiol-disulfide isomerase/thioredoxin
MKLFLIFLLAINLEAKIAPSFEGDLMTGEKANLKSYLQPKRLLFLSFWATWCEPCLSEIKLIRQSLESNPKLPLDILTVNLDGNESSLNIKSTVKEQKFLKYPVILDPEQKIFSKFSELKSLPYSVLLNDQGEILQTFDSYHSDMFKDVEKHLAKLK